MRRVSVSGKVDRMMRAAIWLFFFITVASAPHYAWSQPSPMRSSDADSVMLAVMSASCVQSFLLGGTSAADGPVLAGRPIRALGPVLDAEQMAQLSALVRSFRGPDCGGALYSAFIPRYGFRFLGPGFSLDLLIDEQRGTWLFPVSPDEYPIGSTHCARGLEAFARALFGAALPDTQGTLTPR